MRSRVEYFGQRILDTDSFSLIRSGASEFKGRNKPTISEGLSNGKAYYCEVVEEWDEETDERRPERPHYKL